MKITINFLNTKKVINCVFINYFIFMIVIEMKELISYYRKLKDIKTILFLKNIINNCLVNKLEEKTLF